MSLLSKCEGPPILKELAIAKNLYTAAELLTTDAKSFLRIVMFKFHAKK